MKTIYILTAAAALTLVSCKKEKNTKTEDHSHHTTATITISTPHEGDTIHGDFNVLGSISGSAAVVWCEWSSVFVFFSFLQETNVRTAAAVRI